MNIRMTFLSVMIISLSSFAQNLPSQCNDALNLVTKLRQTAGSPMSALKEPMTVAYYNKVSFLPVMLTFIHSSDDKETIVLEQTGPSFTSPPSECSVRGYVYRASLNADPFVVGIPGATLSEGGP